MTAKLQPVNRAGVGVETIPTPDAASCADECTSCGQAPGTVVFSGLTVGGSRLVLDPPACLCPTCAHRAWRDGYEVFQVTAEGVEVPALPPAGYRLDGPHAAVKGG